MTERIHTPAGNTVWVLGAGASAHAGVPLLASFLRSARHLRASTRDLRNPEAFTRVFDWIERLRATSYYVELDLDNIEQVFSIAEIDRQTSPQHARGTVSSDLKGAIVETINWKECEGQAKFPDSTYARFLLEVKKAETERKSRWAADVPRDVFITFNYDTLLDGAVLVDEQGIDYGFAFQGSGKRVLLKLHGSIGWGACAKGCTHDPVVLAPRYGMLGMREPLQLSVDRGSAPCPKCQQRGLDPVLIPPTWSKAVEGTPLLSVWRRAIDAIEAAEQIVLIGYSMPLTDTFLSYLLSLGLEKNRHLHRVVVVNRDCGSALQDRYRSVFSRGLDRRGALQFVEGEFAALLAHDDLHHVFHDMPIPQRLRSPRQPA